MLTDQERAALQNEKASHSRWDGTGKCDCDACIVRRALERSVRLISEMRAQHAAHAELQVKVIGELEEKLEHQRQLAQAERERSIMLDGKLTAVTTAMRHALEKVGR